MKFPEKTSDIYKIEKNSFIGICVLVMKIRNNIQSMYQKNAVKINMLNYY